CATKRERPSDAMPASPSSDPKSIRAVIPNPVACLWRTMVRDLLFCRGIFFHTVFGPAFVQALPCGPKATLHAVNHGDVRINLHLLVVEQSRRIPPLPHGL